MHQRTQSPNIVSAGPWPDAVPFPRWILRADPPSRPVSALVEYDCEYVDAIVIDGDVDGKAWQWSAPFRHMATGDDVPFQTRVAFSWDNDYLYSAFDITDPGRKAIATRDGTHVYRFDTDAEVLLAGPTGYYEIGVNSIGTKYELSWTWLHPIVESQEWDKLDRLFRLPNYLYFAPQGPQKLGRVGDLDFTLDGLKHATLWSERDGRHGWTVEMAFPWKSLIPILGLSDGPNPGLKLKVQAYRAHHFDATKEEMVDAEEKFGTGASPFEGWTWSVQGNGNVHNLERWNELRLSSERT